MIKDLEFINPFEKLEVWKKAHQFVISIYRITKLFPKEEKYGLIDQLRRASSSIAANIAEGNERKTKKEFLQFLYTAKGSLAETKYFLILARDLNYISPKEYNEFISQANNIGKMLYGLMSYLNHSSFIIHHSSQHAFTLMELLIVIALIALLATAALILLNPLKQIHKSWDAKRKTELGQLRKVLEDWDNDKNCYPKPDQICYDAAVNNTCHLCGNQSGSPSFSPYLPSLPCDPQHPTKDYFYQTDNTSCPSWYRIYTTLNNTADSAITQVGCQSGCGPSGSSYSYNYGVASPNTGLETNQNICSNFSSLYVIVGGICNICGSYSACQSNFPGQTYYIDAGGAGSPGCQTACIKN